MPPPPPPPDPKLVEIESRERVEMAKLQLQAEEMRLKYADGAARQAMESKRLALDAAKAMVSVEQGHEPD